MPPEKKDMDDPVNVDMEPEDALRVLLGGEESRPDQQSEGDDSDESGD